jgi:hypothetical protein
MTTTEIEVETVDTDLCREVETVDTDLCREVETVDTDLCREVETVDTDLCREVETLDTDLCLEDEIYNDKQQPLIVFVCHNNDSISKVIHLNHTILFVGDQEISEEYKLYPKIIIVRDLPIHIEEEKKLLTFTAWYAISKNQLFQEYEYLCILEYDVSFDENFEKRLIDECQNNNLVISFFEVDNYHLINIDVNPEVFKQFVLMKEMEENIIQEVKLWGSSTNQCIHRMIIDDFVDWYYPSCLEIKKNHEEKFSYYHERLFMVYLKSKSIDYIIIDGLSHFQLRSHHS